MSILLLRKGERSAPQDGPTKLHFTFKLLTDKEWTVPAPMPLEATGRQVAKESRFRYFRRQLRNASERQVFAAPMLIQVPFLLVAHCQTQEKVSRADLKRTARLRDGMLEDDGFAWNLTQALFTPKNGQGRTTTGDCKVDKHGAIQSLPEDLDWVPFGWRPLTRYTPGSQNDSALMSQKPPSRPLSRATSTDNPHKSAISRQAKLVSNRMSIGSSVCFSPGQRKISFSFKLWSRAQRFQECYMAKDRQYRRDKSDGSVFAGYVCRIPFQLTATDAEEGSILALSQEDIRQLTHGATSCLMRMASQVPSRTWSGSIAMDTYAIRA